MHIKLIRSQSFDAFDVDFFLVNVVIYDYLCLKSLLKFVLYFIFSKCMFIYFCTFQHKYFKTLFIFSFILFSQSVNNTNENIVDNCFIMLLEFDCRQNDFFKDSHLANINSTFMTCMLLFQMTRPQITLCLYVKTLHRLTCNKLTWYWQLILEILNNMYIDNTGLKETLTIINQFCRPGTPLFCGTPIHPGLWWGRCCSSFQFCVYVL